jgi:hypothetical protein
MRCAGSKHVFMNKKGKRALHIKLSNALCGILKAALFFHQKPTKDSMGTRFALSSRDPCVANEMVNGKLMTLCWHIDNMKVSHCD